MGLRKERPVFWRVSSDVLIVDLTQRPVIRISCVTLDTRHTVERPTR